MEIHLSIPSIPGKPVTFHVLCKVPSIEDVDPAFASARALGIELTANTTRKEESATVVLQVLDWGPDAFKGDRFPSGPVCEKGEYVLCRAYTGTRVMYEGKEYRLINDDHIDMTLQDVQGFLRA